MAINPIYRDVFIDKGENFSQIVEISVPFADYDFAGAIKSSRSSIYSVPFVFSAVPNYPNKMEMTISDENTRLLRRYRGFYDIFATHKITGDVHKEREGIAHYTEPTTGGGIVLPPPTDYQIYLRDVIDAGTAAGKDIEFFATAAQGLLADTAVQPADLGTAAFTEVTDYATAFQGGLADTAVQPGDLPAFGDIVTHDVAEFATAAQGGLADSATQPEDLGTAAAEDVGYFATAAQGALADTAVQPDELPAVALVYADPNIPTTLSITGIVSPLGFNIDLIRAPDLTGNYQWSRTGASAADETPTPPAGQMYIFKNSSTNIWTIMGFDGGSDPVVYFSKLSTQNTPVGITGWMELIGDGAPEITGSIEPAAFVGQLGKFGDTWWRWNGTSWTEDLNANTAITTHIAAVDPHGDRAYADALVLGLLDDRGNFNGSVNTFPTTGGSGTAGAIKKGDLWTLSVVAVSGPLTGYPVGTIIRAIVDTPGQTVGNWALTEVGFGYSPENAANKSTSVVTDQASDTKYPSVKSLWDWSTGKFALSSHPHLSADITDATSDAAANKIAKRGDSGCISFGNDAVGGTSVFASDTSVAFPAQPGIAIFGTSINGIGARFSSTNGDYHATFGTSNQGDNRSFVARLLGAFGWWRGAKTLMVSAVDTLTANRVQRFQDADGTVALTSDVSDHVSATDPHGDRAYANGLVGSTILNLLAAKSAKDFPSATAASGSVVNIGPLNNQSSARATRIWTKRTTPSIQGSDVGVDYVRELDILKGTDNAAIKVEGKYVGYFAGRDGDTGVMDTYHATSSDLVTWENFSLVLAHGTAGLDSISASASSVMKFGATDYRMWYWARDTFPGIAGTGIALATSTDGITWSKSGIIIDGSELVDGIDVVAVPYVSGLSDGSFVMLFEGQNTLGDATWRIYGYTSVDGLNWSVLNLGNPLLNVGAGGTWDDAGVANPKLMELPDGTFCIEYNGASNTPDYYFQIGFARSSTLAGPYVKDSGNPIIGRTDAASNYGTETCCWCYDTDSTTWIHFIQEFSGASTTGKIYKCDPITAAGRIIKTPASTDGAIIGTVGNAAVPFYAETKTWMGIMRDRNSATILLALCDSATVTTPAASSGLAAARRIEVTRTTASNASPGSIFISYFDTGSTQHRWSGSAWTTSTVSVATDFHRPILTQVENDGNKYHIRVCYGDTGDQITEASIPIATVKAFSSGTTMIVGDHYTDTWSGQLFVEHAFLI